MPLIDIRPIKTELRQKYRSLRQSMPQEIKDEKDTAIANQVRRLWQYENNSILLVYVSTSIEVDTFRIIRQALEDGKKVAVPRCIPDTRNMEFYYINSTDELEPGMFGVLEPKATPERLYEEKDGGLCIVPAFMEKAITTVSYPALKATSWAFVTAIACSAPCPTVAMIARWNCW